MKAVSVLVADDYEMVRQGLCSLMEASVGWRTLEASNGREAVLKATHFHPDVVVMDINMPVLNGLEAVQEIRERIPDMPVVVLSGYCTQDLVDQAFAAGARGYVLKTDAIADLVSAVEFVLRGKTFFPGAPHAHQREDAQLPATQDGASILTAREVEIVQLLCEGKANKEVAHELGISTRTVENHRANIMHKLGFGSFSELVRYAIRSAMVQP